MTMERTCLLSIALDWVRLTGGRPTGLFRCCAPRSITHESDVHFRRSPALTQLDPRAAEVVSLRFFSGLSVPEVAEHMGVSARTVESVTGRTRAWLKRAPA